jgi:hypothetical protein
MVDIEDHSGDPETVVLKFPGECSEDSSGSEDESETETRTVRGSPAAVGPLLRVLPHIA